MKMRPLVIADEQKQAIQRLKTHAEGNPVPIQDIFRAMNEPKNAIGNDPNFICVLPIGYVCAFSHEYQPMGLCRHLSVSVEGEGYAPAVEVMLVIMKEFGFTGERFEQVQVWQEEIGNEKVAINVIQPLQWNPSNTKAT